MARAIIIPAESFFITIPLPTKPQEHARSWLPSKRQRKELKALAEKVSNGRYCRKGEKEKTNLMIETLTRSPTGRWLKRKRE
ncbi:MAG: hypothetical protein ACPLW8_06155 [Candidatus Bathyarchaeales archaeon]